MSLTIVCLYIVIGLCFLLFVNYKFLKRFITFLHHTNYTYKTNLNTATVSNNNTTFNNKNTSKDYRPLQLASDSRSVWSIPGPLKIPFFGTKWIYLWKYKMTKIHEVYWEFYRQYGSIVLEVTSNGIPIVNLYNRQDIEKVLRFPSKYPFRPPTEIVGKLYTNKILFLSFEFYFIENINQHFIDDVISSKS